MASKNISLLLKGAFLVVKDTVLSTTKKKIITTEINRIEEK